MDREVTKSLFCSERARLTLQAQQLSLCLTPHLVTLQGICPLCSDALIQATPVGDATTISTHGAG